MKKLFWLCLALCLALPAAAQREYGLRFSSLINDELTLENAIRLGLENNSDFLAAQQEIIIAEQKVKEAGLNDFRRDTLWVAIKDTLFGKGFNADSLPFIPYGKGARFELETRTDSTYSGMPLYLFQAQAAFDTFLNDLNRQQLNALKATCEKENKYAGLRVGDIEQPNNNAGNWE